MEANQEPLLGVFVEDLTSNSHRYTQPRAALYAFAGLLPCATHGDGASCALQGDAPSGLPGFAFLVFYF